MEGNFEFKWLGMDVQRLRIVAVEVVAVGKLSLYSFQNINLTDVTNVLLYDYLCTLSM